MLLGLKLVSPGRRGRVEERVRNTSKQGTSSTLSNQLLSSPLLYLLSHMKPSSALSIRFTNLCFIGLSEPLVCEKVIVIKQFDKVSEVILLFAFGIYVLFIAEHVYTSSCEPHISTYCLYVFIFSHGLSFSSLSICFLLSLRPCFSLSVITFRGKLCTF